MVEFSREQLAAFRLFDRCGVRAEWAWLKKRGTGGPVGGCRWYRIRDYDPRTDLVTLAAEGGEHLVACSLLAFEKGAPTKITVYPIAPWGEPPAAMMEYRGVCPMDHDFGPVLPHIKGLPITCPECGYERDWQDAPS